MPASKASPISDCAAGSICARRCCGFLPICTCKSSTHTPDEERHYTELALRLLDSVDVKTRAAVAARLARHLSPPASRHRTAGGRSARSRSRVTRRSGRLRRAARSPQRSGIPPSRRSATLPLRSSGAHTAPAGIGADVARELNELFFAANANERRLILLNLDIVASVPAGIRRASPAIQRSAAGWKPRRSPASAKISRTSLRVRCAFRASRRGASPDDELGEPIVVAAKALGIPRDLLYRILLFVNTAVGHSVERVHTLADALR